MKTRDRNLNMGVICGMSAGGFAASIIPWSPIPRAALVGCVAAVAFAAVSLFLRLMRPPQQRA